MKEDAMSALTGVDTKTLHKQTKLFIGAISYLDPIVVSCCINKNSNGKHIMFLTISFLRLFGITGLKGKLATTI